MLWGTTKFFKIYLIAATDKKSYISPAGFDLFAYEADRQMSHCRWDTATPTPRAGGAHLSRHQAFLLTYALK